MKEPEISEPSQSNLENIDRPISFYLVPSSGRFHLQDLIPLNVASKNMKSDWRSSLVATEDLRVTQNLSTCLECFSTRPLAIFMPCAHGGCCLRCSVKKDYKQKLCPYCSKVVEFILEMGECSQEVILESTDQEFHVFPILKVIRMVRNSMSNPITPMFGSWSESNSNVSTNLADPSDEGSTHHTVDKSQSGDLHKKSVTTKLPSPRSELKMDGLPRKNSVTSIALNSDQERNGSNRGDTVMQKKSDSDSQEDTNLKSLSHSGVSTDVPILLIPGSHIQVPSPQFRGSLHLKHAPFQFHIDETDSEDSFSSEDRPKSAKGSKESAQGGSQGVEEHHQPKSVSSSRSQYQSKLSLESVDFLPPQPHPNHQH